MVHDAGVVRIEACGAFRLEDPEADRAVGRGIARELLALLVATRDERLDTGSIVDLLWSGEAPPTAGTIVHGAVARIRKALGTEALERDDLGYRLDSGLVSVDLWDAVDLADSGRLAEARHLLAEPLLGTYGNRAWTGPVLTRARALVDRPLPALVEGQRAASGAATAPLIGRRRELAAVRDARRRSRLVTVVGMGGVGKSRLVTEVLSEAGAPAARVDLGRGSGSFATRALIALGAVPPDGDLAALVALEGLVAGIDVLVVDGCEHDLEGAADGLALLLDRWPRLSVLATSRVALGVAGERVVPLLPFDDPGDPRGDAVDLLLDRMQALGLPLATGDRDRAAAIARRCAGVPLAIELAAAQLLAGEDSTPAGSSPEPIVRQHVFDAVGALTPQASDAARRLALLPGGASGPLVEGLVGGGGPGVVRELVTAALLTAEATTVGRRFYLPDTVRQVLVGLTGTGELRAVGAALVEVAGPASPPGGGTAPLPQLAAGIAEIGNARGVLRGLAAVDAHRLRLDLAMAFRMPFFEEGHWAWGAQELQSALTAVEAAEGIDPVERAEVIAGTFEVAGSFQAFAHLVSLAGPAADVAEAVDRLDLVVALRYAEAVGHGYAGRSGESATAAAAVRSAATRSGSEGLVMRADGLDALSLMVGGRPDEARRRFVDIAERALAIGWPGPSARVRHIACMAARAAGEPDAALLDARVAEERAVAGLARANLAAIRADIADLEHQLGASPEAARAALAAAVESATSTGQLRLSGTCRLRLAVLDDDLPGMAHAALELLTVDDRSAAAAVAHVVDRLGARHPLRATAAAAVGLLAAGPGAPLPAGDRELVERLAADPAAIGDDWREELRHGLGVVAGGR